MSVNIFICMGNLTRDIELRYTPKGTAVGESSVALNRVWTTDDGEKKEEVSFVEFAMFGRTAETMAQYFRKGSLVHMQGYIKMEQWEDKQTGAKRSKLKMLVERFSFTGQPTDREPSEPAPKPAGRSARPPSKAAKPAEPQAASDDDCPF